MPRYNMLEKELLTLVICGTIVLLLLFVFILNLLFLYQKKQRKNLEEKLHLQSQFSQTLLQSQLEIREQTLTHVGRELHDNLGQVASLIKINLNTLSLNDKTSAEEKIENTKELIRQLIGDLKALSVSLNSDRIHHLGLTRALELEVNHLNKTELFKVEYSSNGIYPSIDSNKTIIVYRMVQEVLNNMVKHSEAKHISISLVSTEKLITLALSDDGKGFNVEEKTKSGGSGLINLKNRAGLINAQITIQSTPGNGSKVTIELPV